MTTETKAWRLHYGKACNTKYRTEMEEIFKFLEDVTKRLSRPVKDLDDIRFAMASLKDIRENEIRIDMLIGPIEVSRQLNECLNLYLLLPKLNKPFNFLHSLHYVRPKMYLKNVLVI